MKTPCKAFIHTIIKNNEVYLLQLEDGYAMSLSHLYVDGEDNQMEMFCFWSDKKLAQANIQNEWSDYTLASVSLSDFMEDWCIAMSDENYVAGIDLDTELVGKEVDTLELLLDICQVLADEGLEPTFKKFKSVANLLHEAKKALKYE
jgi:hypothetical protein